MDGIEDGVRPADSQIGVLLTREAGERKILGSRRGPDGHGRFAKGPIGGGDRGRHVRGHGRGQNPFTRTLGDRSDPVGSIRRSAGQLVDDLGEVCRDRHVAIRVRGHAEAVRDRKAGPDQLAEIGCFASRQRQRACVEISQRYDERVLAAAWTTRLLDHIHRALSRRQDRQSAREATPERASTGRFGGAGRRIGVSALAQPFGTGSTPASATAPAASAETETAPTAASAPNQSATILMSLTRPSVSVRTSMIWTSTR
jgi:hypothetical protein